jgi:hypothetical protein
MAKDNLYLLSGWSDKIFDIMEKMDLNPKAFIQEIENINLS